ncbi:MAG: cysteine synthase family protein [Parachlamydiales bacterium]|jgi:cystathionine beta-synthase/cysteine synthase A
MPGPAVKTQFPTLMDTVGHTPLVQVQHLTTHLPHITLLLKLEYFNPGASVKDRIVKYIIDDAEARGLLKPGGTIIENTSGNTGAAVAMIAATRGYRAILTMPDKVSIEKQNALKAFGAQIIICPTAAHPNSPEHYVNVAKKLADETPNSFRVNQYDNPQNPLAHYLTTGPEIWEQSRGEVDYFVASASTGGTISGVGRYLKERKPSVKTLMPDPIGSIYYDYFHKGIIPQDAVCSYLLEGIGEDHMAKAIDFKLIDDVVQVKDEDAFRITRILAEKEGILAGGSSGANVWAALQLAEKLDTPATIVAIIPDSGLKYLSKIFDSHWLESQHIKF